ncbi:MAG: cysteine--tRNA ligase [Flavobacteriales bacterium]
MSKLKIQNTLSGKKEEFVPILKDHVGMYVCGPTVYSDVHIGNVRTFLSFDIVYRYLKYSGYKVRYVRNITDVGHLLNDADSGEDKIAKQAKLMNLEPMEVVQHYTNGFHDVMRKFNITPPSIEPSATGHLIEQIEMVQDIIDNGFAYEAGGSVYFDVEKYHDKFHYGKLSGRKIEDLISNTRELDGQSEKRNPLDFAIWKNADESHIMRWNSPWGEGFPGWHLECTVMSTKYLGDNFDIHGGGMDLKFPHHECEIAQSKGGGKSEPANYWMHTNMLTMNGAKMSKSVGNVVSIEELGSGDHPLLEKGFSQMAIRFFMLQSHYSSTLDLSSTAISASEKGFEKLMNAMETLSSLKTSETSSVNVNAFKEKFEDAMNDDFNTPILISHLFEAVKIINSIQAGTETISESDLADFQELMNDYVFEVLGLKPSEKSNKQDELTEELMSLFITLRKEAKDNKNYGLADEIRNKLTSLNITLKDSKEGTSWEKE